MKRSVLITGALVAAAFAGYLAYDQIAEWNRKGLERAREQERERALQEKSTLEQEASSLKAELDEYKDNLLPKSTVKDVFGTEEPPGSAQEKPLTCSEIEGQITSFFDYLEGKEYGKTCEPPGKPFDLFQQMLVQLTEHPPSVSEEISSLESLMKNMAHFYRILGRKRLSCIMSVINRETEIIEPIAASLYGWLTASDCCAQKLSHCPSLDVMYEYAAFFLNTIAGRGYLMRRDPTLRVLTTYYCVLIIDQANDQSLNRHGIDLRPHIDVVYQDISNHRGLINKHLYLKKLAAAGKKYTLDDRT